MKHHTNEMTARENESVELKWIANSKDGGSEKRKKLKRQNRGKLMSEEPKEVAVTQIQDHVQDHTIPIDHTLEADPVIEINIEVTLVIATNQMIITDHQSVIADLDHVVDRLCRIIGLGDDPPEIDHLNVHLFGIDHEIDQDLGVDYPVINRQSANDHHQHVDHATDLQSGEDPHCVKDLLGDHHQDKDHVLEVNQGIDHRCAEIAHQNAIGHTHQNTRNDQLINILQDDPRVTPHAPGPPRNRAKNPQRKNHPDDHGLIVVVNHLNRRNEKNIKRKKIDQNRQREENRPMRLKPNHLFRCQSQWQNLVSQIVKTMILRSKL